MRRGFIALAMALGVSVWGLAGCQQEHTERPPQQPLQHQAPPPQHQPAPQQDPQQAPPPQPQQEQPQLPPGN